MMLRIRRQSVVYLILRLGAVGVSRLINQGGEGCFHSGDFVFTRSSESPRTLMGGSLLHRLCRDPATKGFRSQRSMRSNPQSKKVTSREGERAPQSFDFAWRTELGEALI